MSGNWSHKKRWWMDLLKSVASFGIVALITILVLDRYSERQAKRRAQDDTAFQLRVDAMREFRRATLAYDIAARAAFADLYQWAGKAKTAAMLRYEQDAYAAWKGAMEESLQRHPYDEILRTAVDDLITAGESRHSIYDQLVDERLDGNDSTVIDPAGRRQQFDEYSQKISVRRAQALGRLDYLVLVEPRAK